MDFTINTYKQLLKALQNQGFVFQTFEEYLERSTQPQPKPVRLCHPGGRLASLYPLDKSLQALEGKDQPTIILISESSPSGDRGASASNDKTIILRHDVDKLPENSLRFAQIQHELGIRGSYYFRMVPESFDTDIIKQIANLGHEIGYHYEDIDLVNKTRNAKRKTRNPKRIN